MAYETFNPKTGIKTTYNGDSQESGIAKTEQVGSVQAPAQQQTANQPVASPVQNNQNISPTVSETQNVAAPEKTQQQDTAAPQNGIDILVASGRPFNEEEAKSYAYAKGEQNWQQFVGGTAGNPNPNYIGATNWAQLQKTYTPYQLEKSIIRTKNGIFWNPDVNIGELPPVDPAQSINNDAKKLAEVATNANEKADKFSKETTDTTIDTGKTSLETDYKSEVMSMLQSSVGGNAEKLYNELYNTPEMKSAQSDVNSLKSKIDEYDQQIDELEEDIRREVEGEATESYITALATIRGQKILKMKRDAERQYNTAVSVYNGLKENANNLLQVRTKDSDTRYNQLFSMLQYESQQKQIDFSNKMTMLNFAQGLAEGRSVTMPDGTIVKGLKENDNLNVMSITEANGKTYAIGIDKKTGETKYKTYLGQSKVSGGGEDSAAKKLAELKATEELSIMSNPNYTKAYDNKGNAIYYDKAAYEAALTKWEEDKPLWDFGKKNDDDSKPTIYDFQK